MRGTFAVALALVVLGAASGAGAQSVGAVFEKVNPAVVVVRAKGRDVASGSGQVSVREIGAGVLVSADGKVITAAHVVQAMDEITVEAVGGEAVTARVIASEPAADLALLQLSRVPGGAHPAPMANSDHVKIGDQVVVIGAPYGLRHSMTVGWISPRWPPNTVYPAMPLAEFFQTDAVINSGNSGGPMFSLTGEVIGIVSHNISQSGGSEGLGFVVSINTAKKLLLEEKSFWSGLEGRLLSDELSDLLNVPRKTRGYLVTRVAKGSPADATGLRGGTRVAMLDGEQIVLGGDIVLEVHGIPIGGLSQYEQIRETLTKLPPKATFPVKVLRAGQIIDLTGRKP